MKIAVISDIHEDFQSLKLAEKIISQRSCDAVYCLGDIAGFAVPYYPYYDTRDANSCIRWVEDNCSKVVAGNHDLYAIRKLPQSLVPFFAFPADWYELPYSKRSELAGGKVWLYEDNELSALLDNEPKAFLRQLPEEILFIEDETTVLLTHYIHPDPSGCSTELLHEHKQLLQHLNYMQENSVEVSFIGHMHCRGVKSLLGNNIITLNYGKTAELSGFDWVGVPALTSSRASNGFVIWDTEEKTIEAVSLRKRFARLF